MTDTDDHTASDALADAMCANTFIGDWTEKADAVLTRLASEGWRLVRAESAQAILTEFVDSPPYAAQMYDDPRCVYCTIIVGNEHTNGCLVSRAHAWLAGSGEPAA